MNEKIKRHLECAGLMQTGYESFQCCDCEGSLWKKKVDLDLAYQPACQCFHFEDKEKEMKQNRLKQKNNILKSILTASLLTGIVRSFLYCYR